MKKTALITVLLLCASLAQAELYETRSNDGTVSFSDKTTANATAKRRGTAITHPLQAGALPGIWEARTADGIKTELTLGSNGSFVFDQASASTLHRLYMCGSWEGSEDALSLVVKARKRQLENGESEQAAGQYQEQAQILSAQRDRIILLIHGEELVFDRTG